LGSVNLSAVVKSSETVVMWVPPSQGANFQFVSWHFQCSLNEFRLLHEPITRKLTWKDI